MSETKPQERIKELTDELFDLYKQRKPHEEALHVINTKLGPIEEELLEIMTMNDMKSFEDAKGRGKITWDAPIRAKITNAIDFFLFLRGTGDDAIAKLQVGPDVITDELLEKIKKADPEEIKIGIHWQTLLAYVKDKIKGKDEELESDEDRSENDIFLDEDLWLPGIDMIQNEPALKVKPKKGT